MLRLVPRIQAISSMRSCKQYCCFLSLQDGCECDIQLLTRTRRSMTKFLDRATADTIKARLRTLRADSPRQWGTMTAPQAVAHCAEAMKMAVDDVRPKRMPIGYVIGPVVRKLALGNPRPIRRNSPTSPDLVIRDDRDLNTERERLIALIDRFVAGGPEKCTTHPHTFFGRLTPEQWSELVYKHLDHHLRQFGA